MMAPGLGRLACMISPFACLIPGGDNTAYPPLPQPPVLSFSRALSDNSSFLHPNQIHEQMDISQGEKGRPYAW